MLIYKILTQFPIQVNNPTILLKQYPELSKLNTVDDDLSGIPLKSFRALKPRKSHLSRLPLKSSKAMFLNENMDRENRVILGFCGREAAGRKKAILFPSDLLSVQFLKIFFMI